MDAQRGLHLFKAALLGLCLVFAETGFALRGGGFNAGGGFHPNAGANNWGYHPGYGYDNSHYYDHRDYYNGYDDGDNVWIAPGAAGFYADPVCQNVQTCDGDGNCVINQVCN
ncbi:hypothetical protein [Legionella sp. CNM-4043-24]|uniref:hypothetical protein n=1 Tax=Legionella sp. CNM-4043-24 TaxID=3421646 RepID=UPI00403AEE22